MTLLSLYFNLRQWHTRKLQGKEVQGALLGLWYLCRAALRSADNTHDNNDEPRLKEFAWQIANQVRHLEWGIDKLMVDIGFPLPLEMPETLRPSVPTEKTTEIVREGGRALDRGASCADSGAPLQAGGMPVLHKSDSGRKEE